MPSSRVYFSLSILDMPSPCPDAGISCMSVSVFGLNCVCACMHVHAYGNQSYGFVDALLGVCVCV